MRSDSYLLRICIETTKACMPALCYVPILRPPHPKFALDMVQSSWTGEIRTLFLYLLMSCRWSGGVSLSCGPPGRTRPRAAKSSLASSFTRQKVIVLAVSRVFNNSHRHRTPSAAPQRTRGRSVNDWPTPPIPLRCISSKSVRVCFSQRFCSRFLKMLFTA